MRNTVKLTKHILDRFHTHVRDVRGLSAHTVRAYMSDLEALAGYLGEDELSAARAKQWLSNERRGGLAASSISRKMASVRTFARWAHARGLLEEDIASHLRNPKAEKRLPRVLSEEHVSVLLDQARREVDRRAPMSLRNYAIVEVLYGTGIRVAELVDLTLEHVRDDGRAYLVRGKGDKERIVPTHPGCRQAVEDWMSHGRPFVATAQSGDYLFLGARGGRLATKIVRQMLHRLCARAGVPDISPHALRHSMATHMVSGGADVRIVQELLGHAALTTTQRYTHVDANRLYGALAQAHPRA